MAVKKRVINSNTLVEVFNNDSGKVSYYSEFSRVKRNWDKTDSSKKIPFEELRDQMNTTGGSKLFEDDILLIKDIDIRKELSLKPLHKYLESDSGIKELLIGDINHLEEALIEMSQNIKEKVAHKCIELKIKDIDVLDLIKKYSGLDVLTSIQESKEIKPK